MTDLQQGISYLSAIRAGRGYWDYYDDASAAWYRVASVDVRDLGAAVRRSEDRGNTCGSGEEYDRWHGRRNRIVSNREAR